MILEFLSIADQDRALRSFRKLAGHDIRRWALTRGVAIEIHGVRLRGEPSIRGLNDLDFITDSFKKLGTEGTFSNPTRRETGECPLSPVFTLSFLSPVFSQFSPNRAC